MIPQAIFGDGTSAEPIVYADEIGGAAVHSSDDGEGTHSSICMGCVVMYNAPGRQCMLCADCSLSFRLCVSVSQSLFHLSLSVHY